MAERDILEKVLMSHADVFADCVNTLMYEGVEKLKKEELRPAPTESFYRGKRQMRNQFCDRSFYDTKCGEIRAQYMIENETRLSKHQVLRKASYQGGAYREQLGWKKSVYPVIGIVLDWTGKLSRIPLSLHKLLMANGLSSDELKFVDNVELRLYHMRNLPVETRARFNSDMGFVADYLNEGNFERRKDQKIIHVKALCEMMAALTGDDRFTQQAENLIEKQQKGKDVRMCEYIDMLEAKGEARLGQLIQLLLKEKRYGDIEKAAGDNERRQELYRKYGI